MLCKLGSHDTMSTKAQEKLGSGGHPRFAVTLQHEQINAI